MNVNNVTCTDGSDASSARTRLGGKGELIKTRQNPTSIQLQPGETSSGSYLLSDFYDPALLQPGTYQLYTVPRRHNEWNYKNLRILFLLLVEKREEPPREYWSEHTPLRSGTVDESVLYGDRNPWASQAATPASGAATPNSIAKAEDVHGLALFTSLDFLIIFGIVGTLGGPGLMYINNVGSIVQVLFAVGKGWSRHESEKAQASQVGILSVCSFVGRFGVGFLADHIHTRTLPRTSCLLLSASIGILAISILLFTTDVNSLWIVSALWGVSYGTVFALFPALVLERFGIEHFAQNVGLMGIAAALFGNV
ncbi:hypothetical protein FRC11_009469 [Ceratobasidium sp. 423]|nr:hypothetical protein FRC11_009469 [Ceratobasidium sp. 423]